MTVTYKTEEEKERVILVAVDVEDGTDVEDSLDELNELAETAGAVAVGRLIQKREANCPFALKSREDIYKDLEIAHQQIASGEYQDADEFIVGVKKEYGIHERRVQVCQSIRFGNGLMQITMFPHFPKGQP